MKPLSVSNALYSIQFTLSIENNLLIVLKTFSICENLYLMTDIDKKFARELLMDT